MSDLGKGAFIVVLIVIATVVIALVSADTQRFETATSCDQWGGFVYGGKTYDCRVRP